VSSAAAGFELDAPREARRTRIARLRHHPVLVVALLVIVLWIVVAIAAPLLAPHDPIAQDGPLLSGPSSKYWFGTDELGRDVFSRVIYGARVSIPLGLALVAISGIVGVVVGAVAGFFGGLLDAVLMRIADVVFAFPGIILAMAVTASLGPGLFNAVVALTIVSWPGFARVTRSLVLSVRRSEFVIASRLTGSSSLRSLGVEVGPSIAGPVIVYAVLDVGRAILLLSALSFLGLGARPPAAEWGAMISTATQNLNDWWLGVFPGLAIFTVVAAFNIAGDEIRQFLDPRSQRAAARPR
jgi:peptide/nickel transport system permease protein